MMDEDSQNGTPGSSPGPAAAEPARALRIVTTKGTGKTLKVMDRPGKTLPAGEVASALGGLLSSPVFRTPRHLAVMNPAYLHGRTRERDLSRLAASLAEILRDEEKVEVTAEQVSHALTRYARGHSEAY